jgi:hypothetical protein
MIIYVSFITSACLKLVWSLFTCYKCLVLINAIRMYEKCKGMHFVLSGLIFLAERHTGIICYKHMKTISLMKLLQLCVIFLIFTVLKISYLLVYHTHRHVDNKIHHKYSNILNVGLYCFVNKTGTTILLALTAHQTPTFTGWLQHLRCRSCTWLWHSSLLS